MFQQVYGQVERQYGSDYIDFCEKCCATDPNQRATLDQLLSDPFLQVGATKKESWIEEYNSMSNSIPADATATTTTKESEQQSLEESKESIP